MAAGKCKAAYHTDEWHGYGCTITGGECIFLYPNSKACAEEYGEGPDAEEYREELKEFEDDMRKLECLDCGKQFILGETAVEGLSTGFPICPYCGKGNVECITIVEAGDIEAMGFVAIRTKEAIRQQKE